MLRHARAPPTSSVAAAYVAHLSCHARCGRSACGTSGTRAAAAPPRRLCTGPRRSPSPHHRARRFAVPSVASCEPLPRSEALRRRVGRAPRAGARTHAERDARGRPAGALGVRAPRALNASAASFARRSLLGVWHRYVRPVRRPARAAHSLRVRAPAGRARTMSGCAGARRGGAGRPQASRRQAAAAATRAPPRHCAPCRHLKYTEAPALTSSGSESSLRCPSTPSSLSLLDLERPRCAERPR